MLVTQTGLYLYFILSHPHIKALSEKTVLLWIFKHIHYLGKLNKLFSFIWQIFFEFLPYYMPGVVLGVGDTEESNIKTKCLLSWNSSPGSQGRAKQICHMVRSGMKTKEAGMRIKSKGGGEGGGVLYHVLREVLSERQCLGRGWKWVGK